MTEQRVTPSASGAPLAKLRSRIQWLHRAAGEPSTRELARQIGAGVISHTTVHGVLRCKETPKWGPLELVVEALDGDVNEFRQLWIAVRDIENPPEESKSGSVAPQPRTLTNDSTDRTDPADAAMGEFEFYVDTLADRQVVVAGDLPLRIEGRYSGHPPPVRVILEDSYQRYYVQNPPVRFQPDGTWTAMNVLPGGGIMFVLFVAVDDAGKNMFDRMVGQWQFGAFSELPPGSRILQSIAITRE